MMGGDSTPSTVRSIYDGDQEGDGEGDAPWFLRADDPEEDLEGGAPAEAASLADWVAAEQALVQPLAAAARQLGRLEQSLSDPETGPEPGDGAAARLALQEASDLLWLEGVRLRPERLWMFRVDAGGGDALARADYILGLWALERLTGAWALGDEEALARFLGRRRVDRPDETLADLSGLEAAEETAAARANWLAAFAASATLHPLTRAAYLADLWRRSGPGGRDREVEAIVIAARLAASDVEIGAMRFAPLVFGGRRRAFGGYDGAGDGAGKAEATLARFLEAVDGGARRALLELSRLADWRARADATPLKKSAAGLIPLLASEYAVTTARAEAHLGSVRQTALTALKVLESHGLAREITGGQSFFYWAADLSALPPRVRR